MSEQVPAMATVWSSVQPRYDALAAAPLSAATVDAWLAEWSALEAELDEAATIVSLAFDADTADADAEATNRHIQTAIEPRRETFRVRLAARLVALDLDRPEYATLLRRFQTLVDLSRPSQEPIHRALAALGMDYQSLTSAMTADWEGVATPLPELHRFQLDPDRSVRERAFRVRRTPYIEQRTALSRIFDEQLALRQDLAREAGLANYRDYAFRERDRVDYTVEDCLTLHQTIAEVIVPLLGRRLERRRQRLGVAELRPWDAEVDLDERTPVTPFRSSRELAARAQTMFAALDPALGDYLGTMVHENLLDLDARPNKAHGAYCTVLPWRRRPFIFLHGSTTAQTVLNFIHEVGHAVHVFEASIHPLVFQRWPGAEMAELAAMAMELLVTPVLERDQGGFFSPEELHRIRADQLESALGSLVWAARVDAFQHWVYTAEAGRDRQAREAKWAELGARFDPVFDWSGLADEQAADWYRHLHFYLYPFYAIEYGIAQIGAIQIWQRSQHDRPGAIAAYRRGLALGGTRPLPELFATAGARLAFDAGALTEVAHQVERELIALDSWS